MSICRRYTHKILNGKKIEIENLFGKKYTREKYVYIPINYIAEITYVLDHIKTQCTLKKFLGSLMGFIYNLPPPLKKSINKLD